MPSGYPLNLLEPVNAKRVGTNAKYEHGLEHDEKHCLNLNIYVPVEALRKKDEDGVEPVPVMVWIHGGAFRDGSNGLPMYGMHSILCFFSICQLESQSGGSAAAALIQVKVVNGLLYLLTL